jgi:hypothetical protein
VGKLPDGIVIEIATWRGTGRPDSRTNRMMLGVSYDEDVIEENKKKSFFEKIRKSPEPASQIAIENISAPAPVVNNSTETTPVFQEVEDATPATSEDVQIENSVPVDLALPEIEELPGSNVTVIPPSTSVAQPINLERNMQDLMGARPRAQLMSEPSGAESRLNKHAHEIVKRNFAKRGTSVPIKNVGKWVGYLSALGIAFYVAVVPMGLRLVHPDLGLKTALSSAHDALVIVKKADDYAVGDTVVAASEGKNSPNVFGAVAAVSGTEYVLEENSLYHSALKDRVHGKVVLVIPGLGKIFSIFN